MHVDATGRRAGCVLGLLCVLLIGPVRADEGPSAAASAASVPASAGRNADLRAATVERLAQLGDGSDGESSRPISAETRKTLIELFQARLKTLDALDHATTASEHARNPETTAAQERDALDAELARLEAERNSSQPHLPEIFAPDALQPVSTRLNAMRDAISSAKEALKESVEELESLRAEIQPKSEGGRVAELKNRREELQQRLEDLAAARAATSSDDAGTTNTDAPSLRKEKRTNLDLEIQVKTANLDALDATIGREAERSELAELRLRTQTLRVEVRRRRLHAMQARYQALADDQRRALEKAAGEAVRLAERSKDPIGRFRAKRGAVLLALQAQLLSEEKELSSTPQISSHEQERLTREASDDLENLHTLIEGGRSTALVALRLTNSYRRIAQQRETVVSHELAAATAILTRYENLLTSVELDILNDSREDRQEFEALLAQLPASRHQLARATFEELEDQHRELLESRRKILTTLAKHAETTRASILRRIDILDDQYAYIRTHIFWVRDAQPLSVSTLQQMRAEGRSLVIGLRGLLHAHWRGEAAAAVTVDFVLASVLALIVPFGLVRVRRLLFRRIQRDSDRRITGMLPLS